MFDRLRSDFHLAIITLCGGLAVVAILPFAVYRFVQGQYVIVLVDLALAGAILGTSVHAWRTGRTERAGITITAIATAGLALVVGHIGMPGVLWSYALLALNFFISPRTVALLANAVLIVAIELHGNVFASDLESITYVVTAILVTLFSFIIAVRTDMQREQLEALASHDTLTGAGNRRLLEVDLAHAQAQFRSGKSLHGLALLDLDRFKRVNDEHGHEAGDDVLRSFSAIVGGSVRKMDRFYRYGGEEFVLLLPVGGAEGLSAALGKVHERLRAGLRGPDGPVTVSIGAALPKPDEHWTAWLARADAALYRAKRSGRDLLVVAEDATSGAQPFERRSDPATGQG